MTQADIRPLPRSGGRGAATGAPLPEEAPPHAASAERVTPQGLELRHLRYFVAVADAGTFTQAAEQMFIAQPTLSQQIRRLEEMVGTTLLRRRREGVELTAAGSVLLEESRTVLSLIEHAVSMARKVAGLGRPLLRVVIPPGMPEVLAAVTAVRLQRMAANAGVDVAWLETFLDGEFSLIEQRRADAALGWVTPDQALLPDRLDVMTLGEFEPEAWVPSSHPAARLHRISLGQLADLEVAYGPRRVSASTYDSWLAVLRSADPRFEFADPPFQQPLLMTLAFAATASRPTAVLTGPRYPAGARGGAREDPTANTYDMVPVRLDHSPLTANACLVWNADLPRPLQQIIFDTADGITL
jgi:DNA-binding transcriptional LysR family regulator